MIDWDGTIFQGADVRDKAIHGGPINGVSVGVDLNNRLPLQTRTSKARVLWEVDSRQFVDPAYKRPLSEFKVINITPKRSMIHGRSTSPSLSS